MIPLLVRELVGKAERWEELIPAVFSVSLTEFEEDWNAWLLVEYPSVHEALAIHLAYHADEDRAGMNGRARRTGCWQQITPLILDLRILIVNGVIVNAVDAAC